MSRITRPTGRLLYRIRHHLRRGGLIAYPTESSYGLGCLPNHTRGLTRLIKTKKRPQYKGLITIGAAWSQLQPLLNKLPKNDLHAITSQWPAPLTFLLPAKQQSSSLLRGARRTSLAVRIPMLSRARYLCHGVQSALVSTSCNRSKQRPCRTEREVWHRFGRQVIIIGGKTGGRKKPSTIIDWYREQIVRS